MKNKESASRRQAKCTSSTRLENEMRLTPLFAKALLTKTVPNRCITRKIAIVALYVNRIKCPENDNPNIHVVHELAGSGH